MKSCLSSLDLSSINGSQALDPALEQIIESVAARLQDGESFDLDQLIAEHPAFAEHLRKLVPMIASLVELREAAVDRTEAAATSGEPAPLPYKELGDFRLVRELGRGGMGTVYEAEQLSMGRHVALKVLPFAALAHDKSLQRFRNEVRAAAALDHSHIVSIYSVGEDHGVHYYTMQLIRGQTLADMIGELRRIQRTPSPSPLPKGAGIRSDDVPTIDSSINQPPSTKPEEQCRISTAVDSPQAAERYRSAARLGIQAAKALQHAHDQGVLHRDIKPSNLMLDAEGQLYITDFGLARIEADAGMTMTGDIIGTLRYMAPEQALSKRVVIDHRADVYSLGATLYELLTLQPAFGETDRSELLKQIAFEEPRPLRKLDRHIPAELETIVLKAMEKSPEVRYQTAQRLADDLRAFLEHRPIKAKPPMIVERAAKWSRRHRPVVWASALALLAVGTVVSGTAGWIVRDRQSRRVAVDRRVSNALRDVQTAYQENNLDGAFAALKSIVNVLSLNQADTELIIQAQQWQSDLNMVDRLEQLRLSSTILRPGSGTFEPSKPPPDYMGAFLDYGLNVYDSDPANSAALIRGSQIRDHLISSLDSWAWLVRNDARQALLRLADTADKDAWRRQIRQAAIGNDGVKLAEFAGAEACLSQPAVTIVNLTIQLYVSDRKAEAIALLRQAQRAYPNDFWINHVLGTALVDSNPGEAVGFLRAALSERPSSSATRINLARALTLAWNYLSEAEKDDRSSQTRDPLLVEAEMQYIEAARLDPLNPVPCQNLAYLLRNSGRISERADWARRALRLDADFIDAHYMIADGYAEEGNLEAAAEAYKTYSRKEPTDTSVLVPLAKVLYKQGRRTEAKNALDGMFIELPRFEELLFEAADLMDKLGDPSAANQLRHDANRLLRERGDDSNDLRRNKT